MFHGHPPVQGWELTSRVGTLRLLIICLRLSTVDCLVPSSSTVILVVTQLETSLLNLLDPVSESGSQHHSTMCLPGSVDFSTVAGAAGFEEDEEEGDLFAACSA